jgi:hypothetical protein
MQTKLKIKGKLWTDYKLEEKYIELTIEDLAKQLSWQEVEELMELTTQVVIKIQAKEPKIETDEKARK